MLKTRKEKRKANVVKGLIVDVVLLNVVKGEDGERDGERDGEQERKEEKVFLETEVSCKGMPLFLAFDFLCVRREF